MTAQQVSTAIAEETAILARNVGRQIPLPDLVRVQEIQDALAANDTGEAFGV